MPGYEAMPSNSMEAQNFSYPSQGPIFWVMLPWEGCYGSTDCDKVSETSTLRTPTSLEISTVRGSNRATQIRTVIQAVTDGIDRLHRLSNAIRRAGAEKRNLRTAEFEWKDEEGNDLGPIFLEDEATPFLQVHFPGLSEVLHQRLASTMLARRKRLVYLQHHREKLATRATGAVQKFIKVIADRSEISKPSQKQGAVSGVPVAVKPVGTSAPQTLLTVNTAATPHDPERFHKLVTPSRVGTVKSAHITQETKESFPPPPRIREGDNDFLCPYCCLVLPIADATDRRRWTYVKSLTIFES